MNYKKVPVSKLMHIMVPDNLTPDEEAIYIASRIAYVNFEELEAGIEHDLSQFEEGKMIAMEDTLAELSQNDS